MTDTLPDVAVVIPAYNGAPFLPHTLAALKRAAAGRIVVIDAGSTDGTEDVSRAFGAHVIRLPEKAGPARARNIGVAETQTEVVLFVDADCVAHPDVIDRVREAFRSDSELVSLSGSYDSEPAPPGFFSQYMSLRHHFFHQRARREEATFWAGCGAVRRSAFWEVGGFDDQRFPSPQIEDIELGIRLRRVGRTRLDPDLQVTHLKCWTLMSVIDAEIRARAIPWARLILETGEIPNDLNLVWLQRLAAGLSPFALAALFVAPWAAWTGHWIALAAAALVFGASIALHAGMLRFFARLRGAGFAVRAWLFHQVHLFYSAATIALCALAHLMRSLRAHLRPGRATLPDR